MYGAARRIAGWALALPLIAGLGCYPGEFDQNSYNAVATLRDTAAAFGTAATFALADSVIHLTPPGSDDELSRIYDQQILDRIRTNMTGAGYTEVLDPTVADLHVLTLATSSTYYGYYWDAGAATTAGGIPPMAAATRAIGIPTTTRWEP